MIKQICVANDLAIIHAITSKGGVGKSKNNKEDIGIYERFKFNIEKRVGVPSSVFKNITTFQKTFGSQGIIIYDGVINNVNRSDAGSFFNDKTNEWETTEGILNPTYEQTKSEIAEQLGYVEINIKPNYTICGIFLDLVNPMLITQIGDFPTFFKRTEIYKLPYYGLTDMGIVLSIDEKYLANNNVKGVYESPSVSIGQICDGTTII